jgi:hypothetical protein
VNKELACLTSISKEKGDEQGANEWSVSVVDLAGKLDLRFGDSGEANRTRASKRRTALDDCDGCCCC